MHLQESPHTGLYLLPELEVYVTPFGIVFFFQTVRGVRASLRAPRLFPSSIRSKAKHPCRGQGCPGQLTCTFSIPLSDPVKEISQLRDSPEISLLRPDPKGLPSFELTLNLYFGLVRFGM